MYADSRRRHIAYGLHNDIMCEEGGMIGEVGNGYLCKHKGGMNWGAGGWKKKNIKRKGEVRGRRHGDDER